MLVFVSIHSTVRYKEFRIRLYWLLLICIYAQYIPSFRNKRCSVRSVTKKQNKIVSISYNLRCKLKCQWILIWKTFLRRRICGDVLWTLLNRPWRRWNKSLVSAPKLYYLEYISFVHPFIFTPNITDFT